MSEWMAAGAGRCKQCMSYRDVDGSGSCEDCDREMPTELERAHKERRGWRDSFVKQRIRAERAERELKADRKLLDKMIDTFVWKSDQHRAKGACYCSICQRADEGRAYREANDAK